MGFGFIQATGIGLQKPKPKNPHVNPKFSSNRTLDSSSVSLYGDSINMAQDSKAKALGV